MRKSEIENQFKKSKESSRNIQRHAQSECELKSQLR